MRCCGQDVPAAPLVHTGEGYRGDGWRKHTTEDSHDDVRDKHDGKDRHPHDRDAAARQDECPGDDQDPLCPCVVDKGATAGCAMMPMRPLLASTAPIAAWLHCAFVSRKTFT